jgi:hypothetical protein
MTGIDLFYFPYTLVTESRINIVGLEALTACHIVC